MSTPINTQRFVLESAPGSEQVLVVKNTFLDVSEASEEESPVRRWSMPPSLRSIESLKPDFARRWDSDASTADSCTEVSDDEISMPSPAACSAGPESRAALPGQQPTVAAAGPSPAATRADLSSEAQAWQPKADGAAPPVLLTQPGGGARSRLQANTPAFTPMAPPPSNRASNKFNRSVGGVVSTVKASLEACPLAQRVEVSNVAKGWTLSVHVGAEDRRKAEYVLKIAKETLLWCTKTNSSVKVLGEYLTPFLSRPNGFMATLGSVSDESKACYDAYGKGFCRRGHSCRWQHPPCMGSVQVLVVAPPVESR